MLRFVISTSSILKYNYDRFNASNLKNDEFQIQDHFLAITDL